MKYLLFPVLPFKEVKEASFTNNVTVNSISINESMYLVYMKVALQVIKTKGLQVSPDPGEDMKYIHFTTSKENKRIKNNI